MLTVTTRPMNMLAIARPDVAMAAPSDPSTLLRLLRRRQDHPDTADPHSSQPQSQACDFCRRRRRKCSRGHPCAHCQAKGIVCKYEDILARPGAPNAVERVILKQAGVPYDDFRQRLRYTQKSAAPQRISDCISSLQSGSAAETSSAPSSRPSSRASSVSSLSAASMDAAFPAAHHRHHHKVSPAEQWQRQHPQVDPILHLPESPEEEADLNAEADRLLDLLFLNSNSMTSPTHSAPASPLPSTSTSRTTTTTPKTTTTHYEHLHSGGPTPFERVPASPSDLLALREQRFGTVCSGLDPAYRGWRCDAFLLGGPVLVGNSVAQAPIDQPQVLFLDENLLIQSQPAAAAVQDPRTLYLEGWEALNPRGELIAPQWDMLREGSRSLAALWPSNTCSEEEYDGLRQQAASLLSHPVLGMLITLGVAQNADQLAVYLPDLNRLLVEASRPNSSISSHSPGTGTGLAESGPGLGWSKLRRRQTQALLLALAVPATQWYGALAIDMGGCSNDVADLGGSSTTRNVKISTWELGAHLSRLAYVLLQPLDGQEGPEHTTQELLSTLLLWGIAQRCNPLFRQMGDVIRSVFTDEQRHAVMLHKTQYLPVEREVYKRTLASIMASVVNRRIWQDFHLPFRCAHLIRPLGPISMLAGEALPGTAKSTQSWRWDRLKSILDMISEDILDSSLFEPLQADRASQEWATLARRRETEAEQYYTQLIEWKQQVFDAKDIPKRGFGGGFGAEADIKDYKMYTSWLLGSFGTVMSLITTPLKELRNGNALPDLAEAHIASLPKFEVEEEQEGEEMLRVMQWNHGTQSVAYSTVDYGNAARGAKSLYETVTDA